MNKFGNNIKIFLSSHVIQIIVFGILIKGLGFLKSVLIADTFGLNSDTDIYYLSLSLVTILTSFFGGALNQAIIPLISRVERKEGESFKIRYINNLVTLFAIISLVIIAILILFTPHLVSIVTFNSLTSQQQNLAILLIRIGLPSILIYNLTGIYRGYLQSENNFLDTAVNDLPFNIIYIIYIIFLGNQYGIVGLMVTHLLAVSSQLLLQYFSLKRIHFPFKIVFQLKNIYLKDTLQLIFPIFLSLAVIDINLLIDKSFASTLESGAISALEYGNKLNVLILQLFITSLSIVIFPKITKEFQRNNKQKVTQLIEDGIFLILSFVIPIVVIILMFRYEIVEVLFQRGAFDSQATEMTSNAMAFYIVGLLPSSIKTLLNKVFYATDNTNLSFYNSIFTLLINTSLNYILITIMSYSGLAFATSLASWFTMVSAFYMLKRKNWVFNYGWILRVMVKSLIAITPASLLAYYIFEKTNIYVNSNIGMFLLLFIVALISLSIYLIIFLLLNKMTLKELVRKVV